MKLSCLSPHCEEDKRSPAEYLQSPCHINLYSHGMLCPPVQGRLVSCLPLCCRKRTSCKKSEALAFFRYKSGSLRSIKAAAEQWMHSHSSAMNRASLRAAFRESCRAAIFSLDCASTEKCISEPDASACCLSVAIYSTNMSSETCHQAKKAGR